MLYVNDGGVRKRKVKTHGNKRITPVYPWLLALGREVYEKDTATIRNRQQALKPV